MSDISDYNEALAAAKLKALRVLRELLLTCEDPTERRRIAKAILDARPPQPKPKAPVYTNREQPPTAPAPVKAPRPLSPHALGTLNLDTQSLPILAGGGSTPPRPAEGAPIPITLTPSDEPAHFGGPAGTRPLPLPLGPPRA